jgi:glycosyltransferase involved in cell wall biosynthesis
VSKNQKYRVLVVSANPVQYAVPVYRLMAQDPTIDLLVAYCSLQGAERGLDPGFGIDVAWDIPLLNGYPWLHVPNKSPNPGLERSWGLINPDLYTLIRSRHFDAVFVSVAYTFVSFWIAVASAKLMGSALLLSTAIHDYSSRDQQSWKWPVKVWFWPRLFSMADVMIATASGGANLLRSMGIPSDRIVLAPHTIDYDLWVRQAQQVDLSSVRAQWGIPQDGMVVLFCAKLQPWKRPQDVLHAFAKANLPNSWLVYAGDGSMHLELEELAQSLHVAERVRFLGFVNQSQLPSVYVASDLLVLPSEYEPFGAVVSEAMSCGRPAILSDQVGAHFDLIQPGITGFVYPCGNLDALTTMLCQILPDRARLRQLGMAAQALMATRTPHENAIARVKAVEMAVALKRRKG